LCREGDLLGEETGEERVLACRDVMTEMDNLWLFLNIVRDTELGFEQGDGDGYDGIRLQCRFLICNESLVDDGFCSIALFLP
jgi:hypothetical protein